MLISNKQRAKVNSAAKPIGITTNFLGPGLQYLLKYYTKYYLKRRFSIVQYLTAYKNSKSSYILTIRFNKLVQKGGFAKKRLPLTWNFYGNVLLTKYGKKKQQKDLKNKQIKALRQKSTIETIDITDKPIEVEIIEDSVESNVESNEKNIDETIETRETVEVRETVETGDKTSIVTPINPNDLNEKVAETNKEKSSLDDEIVDNIWNLDIQEVAALIVGSELDEKQASECEFIDFSSFDWFFFFEDSLCQSKITIIFKTIFTGANGEVVNSSSEISATKENSGNIEQSSVNDESQDKTKETPQPSGNNMVAC